MEFKQIIIIPVCNQCKQIEQNLPLLEDINGDILMIDDGSTDTTYDIIKEHAWLKYIKHEQNLGIGAAIITGCDYARDLGYDVAIVLNLNDNKFKAEIQQLMENINYGYDIVNSSRILENYNYADIPQEFISLTSDLSSHIRDITGFDITDPLSGIMAIRLESLKDMELTEFNHSLLLQLWIQADYFGLSIIEVPAQSGIGFGEELTLYDDPMGLFLSLMEAEKILYPKKNLN
jgi:glycosyltransferase involved in cell wall biosynthesis